MDTETSQRRSPVSLALLWMSMITGFPPLLIAFEWHKAGLALSEVICASLVGVAVTLAYCLPAAFLGASTGKSYSELTEETFGKKGSCLLSSVVGVMFFAWFGLLVNLFAQSLCGLLRITTDQRIVAVAFAVLLSLINRLGFSGVIGTCAYLAAPILLLWVITILLNVTPAVMAEQFCHAPAKFISPQALALVSPFVIGYTIYGNEPDFWRFAKPTRKGVLGSLLFALLVNVLFGAVGWLVCRAWHPASQADLIRQMNAIAFGQQTWLAAIVLIASSLALANANLFVAALSLQRVTAYFSVSSPRWTVPLLSMLAAATITDTEAALRIVPLVSSIALPTVTVIMICNRHWPARHLSAVRASLSIKALILAVLVGVISSGQVPGCAILKFGISSVNAWLAALIAVAALRLLVRPDPA